MQLNNPRQSARELLKESVPNERWEQNGEFLDRLRERIGQHPVSKHPAIKALRSSTFDLEAIQQIHLEYRHAIVQIFTDALLMAQVQTKQLEPDFESGVKMYARFLLTLNVLDEFGFKPGVDDSGYYRGNALGAHYPLYEEVLDELGIDRIEREQYKPSEFSRKLRSFLESSYDDLSQVVSLLAAGERVVVLFSSPLRDNAKTVGVDTSKGYYMVHGASDDEQSEGDDDTHEDDLWYILMQSLSPEQYENIEAMCEQYCDLWVDFWNAQMQLVKEQEKVLVSA
ncbi:hypothetical protein S7335_5200 [Synechococcus sp. PCC 7335]|uniref:hypothetical protein n=1 Tax=Synechococcus sp. (strain ATCC 29403 / PCC 7335) TaxID=91464 RepID=UPI00017ED247|nr:hypothetical protein [Synechococcus sp. PCC 7335]EDX87490.1 hypothetical protein S7335_5200 [Synechococcus sp. PCC 7335]